MSIGVALLAVATAIGTYERSALIGLVILGIYMFVRSQRKLAFGLFAGVVAIAILVLAAKSWEARVSTIQDYSSDGSAMTRILMWKWTLGFVATHPLGGGFDAYGTSSIVMPPDPANPGGYIQVGRAYHSIYFEVLGDLGYPGFIMFVTAIISSLVSLIRLSRKCRKVPDLRWVADMSDAVQSGMLVFLSSGAFVGIAFQPPFWYFVAMGVSLRAYVYHAERAELGNTKGWRLVAQRTREAMASRSSGWQRPPVLPREKPSGASAWRGAPTRRVFVVQPASLGCPASEWFGCFGAVSPVRSRRATPTGTSVWHAGGTFGCEARDLFTPRCGNRRGRKACSPKPPIPCSSLSTGHPWPGLVTSVTMSHYVAVVSPSRLAANMA